MSNENLSNKSLEELREIKAKGEAELKRLHNKSKYYNSQIKLLMNAVVSYVARYEQFFRKVMTEKLQVESEEKFRVWKKQLSQNKKRIAELDRLFIKIYKDNAKGTLSDEKFEMVSQRYEEKQLQLKLELVTLQKNIEVQEQQIENLEQFIQLASKYADGVPLMPYSLRELVKRIYVSAADKSSGKRKQSISIEYDFIGFIPLNELMQKKSARPKSRRTLKIFNFQKLNRN